MFLDDANKKYFLKMGINGWNYLQLDELIVLSVTLNSINPVLNALKEKSKSKMIPKVIVGGTAITLSLAVLLLGFSKFMENRKSAPSSSYSYSFTYPEDGYEEQSEFNNCISYEESQKPNLTIDTERTFGNYHYVYDMSYLDHVLNYKSVTINDLYTVIDGNSKISPKYKELLKTFCKDVTKKYPNIELRVLYENLKTLEVIEKDKIGLSIVSGNSDSYGCYKKSENKIYVLKDQKYDYGTWAHQVLYHEFGHCLRTGIWDKDGKTYQVQVNGINLNNNMLEEALNSLFAVSIYNYEEKDVAYQLQSNYNKVMIECLGNSYDLSDYVNHSLSYYAFKLDQYNHDDNYAVQMIELMTMQFNSYYNKDVVVSQEEMYPLYDYIAKMYYQKYLTQNMSYQDAKKLTDELLEKILYDVPSEYNIDINHFYEYLNEYCEANGIRQGVSR